MRHFLGVLMCLPVVSACASTPWEGYWKKPTKYKELPETGSIQPVATLSLDASRRLVIAQTRGGDRYTCPEPPPDVSMNTLDQIIASIKTRDGTGASYGAASQAVSQVLSSRTGVVEMWRTTSSMYCVLLMNSSTAQADAYLKAATTAILNVSKDAATVQTAAALADGLAQMSVVMAEQARNQDAAAAEAKKRQDAALRKRCDALSAEARAADAECKTLPPAAPAA